MEEVHFQQVESNEQKEQAGALILEYLEWLNERVRHDYGIEFDVNAMVESDLSDSNRFRPPDGRFYLAQYDKAVAGVCCLKKLTEGVGEIHACMSFRHSEGRALAGLSLTAWSMRLG